MITRKMDDLTRQQVVDEMNAKARVWPDGWVFRNAVHATLQTVVTELYARAAEYRRANAEAQAMALELAARHFAEEIALANGKEHQDE